MSALDWILVIAVSAQAIALLAMLLAALGMFRRFQALQAELEGPKRQTQRMAATGRQLAASATQAGRQLAARAAELRALLQRRSRTLRHALEEIRRPAREEVPAAGRAVRETVREARSWTDRLARLRRAASTAAVPPEAEPRS